MTARPSPGWRLHADAASTRARWGHIVRDSLLSREYSAVDVPTEEVALSAALTIPYSHHERWDGTGYPRGLEGEQIPIEARIFAVAEAWVRLQLERPQRKAWTEAKTIKYLKKQAGKEFDQKIVEAFLEIVEADNQ